jgi:hypothetical protein
VVTSAAGPIPETLDEVLTPGWLNAALRTRFPGIEITAVAPGPVVSRVSTNARFTIECAGGVPGGLSPHLCAKGYFGEYGALARTAGVPEASFYRDLADATGVRTLRAVYADVDLATSRNVVVTEDVVAAGATFLDALAPFSPDQVAASLEQLAVLHAATWCRRDLATSWLAPRLARTLEARGLKEIRGNFDGPIGSGVPDAVRDAERLVASYRALAKLAAEAEPWCIVHGDAHIGNVFLDRDGAPAFVDWQLVQRAPWWLDVGYHVASALTIDDRRRAERDLLRSYLSALERAGGEPPSWDDGWLGYRRGIVHGFFLWGITLKVAPPITTELLTRLGTAAADHDSFATLS